MKKIMKLFVLVAAAAMTLASCQKNEISGPVKQEVYFTIKADFEETKTAITDNGDKTYTPTWANGDKIGVLFALEEKAQAVEFANTADAGETATFEGKHAFTVVEGASEVSGNLYAFYPSSAFDKEKTIYSNGEIRLDLNVRQNPTSTSFDPSCDLMIAKPCYYVAEATGESVEVLVDDMYFARMMSVLRINLNSTHLSNETVKSVSFDAEGLDLTGAMRFNLETGKFVGNLSTSQDLSEVTAVYSEEDPIYVAGEKNSAYLVVAPVTIPSGTTLTFTIETENYDIVKTVTAPADMVMPAGNIAVINLTISEDDCATKDNSDYSGTYIVVAKKSDIYYYMSTLKDGGLSGNNRTAISSGVSEITDYTSSKTDFAGVEETCVWNVAKVDGGYTFANMDNTNYLYTTDANRAMMGTVDQASIFTVSVENNIYTITDNVYYRTLSLNTSSDLFACYGSGQNPELTLIPYVADTTPKITVEDTEYNVSADDETLEFSYTTKNIDGTPTVSVADGATMKNVEADAEAGIVTVIFDANAEEVEKTATLVLSYEGAESVYVTITQAAKAAEGGAYYEKVTSAPADWSGEYLLVYEDEKYLFDGSLTNVDSSPNYTTLQSISDRLSFADYSKYAVTIEKYDTGYSVKTASGLYIGRTSNSNGFNSSSTTQYANTISFTSGKIKIAGSGGRVFNYNSQSGKFRFFASTNAPLVSAYKLVGGNEGGETPVEKTLESIAVSDAKTEYTVGDEFVEPTVTATYSDGSTEDVTASAEFTGYDMSADDTYTVTVSYSGKTTTYSITVSPAQGGGDEGGDSVEQTATFNFKQIYSENGGATSNVTVGDITFVGEKGTGSTPARAWSDGLRLYAGCKVTFKAADGYVITSISGDTALAFTGSQQTVEFSGLTKKTISANIIVTYKAN